MRQRGPSATSSSQCTVVAAVVACNAMLRISRSLRGPAECAAVLLAFANGGCWLTESLDDLPRWCVRQSPTHRFCADFDAVDHPEADFSAHEMMNGTWKLDDSTFVSPPRAVDMRSSATQEHFAMTLSE